MENWSNYGLNWALAAVALALLLIPASKMFEKKTKFWVRIIIAFSVVIVSAAGVKFTNLKEDKAERAGREKDSTDNARFQSFRDGLKKDTVTINKTVEGKATLTACSVPEILRKSEFGDTIRLKYSVCNAGQNDAFRASVKVYSVVKIGNELEVIPGAKTVLRKTVSGNGGHIWTEFDTWKLNEKFQGNDLWLYARVDWDNKPRSTPLQDMYVYLAKFNAMSAIYDDAEYKMVKAALVKAGVW